MKWKNGVVRKGEVWYNGVWHTSELSPEIMLGLETLDVVSKELTGNEITVTCGIEGRHGDDSLHPYGMAADVRRWGFTEEGLKALVMRAGVQLKGYDIIIESDHVHIEYDPK